MEELPAAARPATLCGLREGVAEGLDSRLSDLQLLDAPPATARPRRTVQIQHTLIRDEAKLYAKPHTCIYYDNLLQITRWLNFSYHAPGQLRGLQFKFQTIT